MDIVTHNRMAWNKAAEQGSRWATPHSPATIEAALNGAWEINLCGDKSVPKDWFGPLKGMKVLCLASGGGQQAPLLAAAGASVTSFDNSDEQLAKDKLVADRDSLDLRIVQGDMADLSVFDDESFDLIYHPVSNHCIPDVTPVWRECFRVLRWNGRLLSGFLNPAFFLFDHVEAAGAEALHVKYSLPYSDLTSISAEEREKFIKAGDSLEFGHSLEDLVGGQIGAGFSIIGFQEGAHEGSGSKQIDQYFPRYIATLARKFRIGRIGRGNE